MKTSFAVLRSKGVKVSAAVATLFAVSGAAYADIAADIGTAQTAAESNVGLAITAVIAIAALVMGLGIIVSLIRK